MTIWWSRPAPVPAAVVMAARLGFVGGALGVAAGAVELAIGASIRPWIGGKQDTSRLGLLTVTLAVVALLSSRGLGSLRGVSASHRALLTAGLLIPGLVGFTTVGRLWLGPGALLVTAGALSSWDLLKHCGAIVRALDANAERLLAATLGCMLLGLGMTAHGVDAIAGIVGGVVVVILAARPITVRRPAACAVLAVAVVPFALLTWWSIVSPLLAALTVVVGTMAVHGTDPPCSAGARAAADR